MGRVFKTLVLGFGILSAPAGWAAGPTVNPDAECRSIAEVDLSDCSCRGRYFESKFGPEDGVAALHLAGRSYVPEPRITVNNLYERFGAEKLNQVAQRMLGTQDEVLSYCPLSRHMAD